METHSSTLAWNIPQMEEPGRLQSMGSLRVGHDWATSLSSHFHALEKEMATHSSVLAWRIPGTGKPGGLLTMGLHRVGHDWSDLTAAVAVAESCPALLQPCGLSHQTPLSMRFPRQEYWSGLPFPFPGGSSQLRDWTLVFFIAGGFFKPPGKPTGYIQFSSGQLLSCVRLFVTPWIAAHQASLSITNSWSSLRLTCIKSVMSSSHLILCCPLLLPWIIITTVWVNAIS